MSGGRIMGWDQGEGQQAAGCVQNPFTDCSNGTAGAFAVWDEGYGCIKNNT